MATFIARVGGEILVNTTTNNSQEAPQITALDGGGFVVTWQDLSQQNGDTSSYAVRAQVFEADGEKVGSEILVNTTTNSSQWVQQITALDGGGFVVTWQDSSQQNGDTSGASVRAQVFEGDGDKVGSEILVNTTTNNSQVAPQITALDGGGFVVTWQDWSGQNGDTSGTSVRAQVFEADGDKVGSEILVNTTTNSNQLGQQITALEGGGFVVTWQDWSGQNGDTSGTSVRAQVFEADGDKVGSEILVNTTTFTEQYAPQITALEGGGFVVTWQDSSQQNGDTSGWSVRAQVFEADGDKVGSEILVNTTTTINQVAPQITALDGGGFVVTWWDESQQNGDTSSSSVRAQVFEADGDKAGSEILVNTTTNGSQLTPQITALDGGDFVVTWRDDSGRDWNVRAQVFAADGEKAGSEILVNTTTSSHQIDQQIIALDGGGFVVTWLDDSQSGGDTSSWAVRAQIFNFNVTDAIDDTAAMDADDVVTPFDVRVNDTPSDAGTVAQTGAIDVVSPVAGLDQDDLTVTIAGGKLEVDLGADFDKLTENDSATVIIPYTITDPFGGTDDAELTITVILGTDIKDTDTAFSAAADYTISLNLENLTLLDGAASGVGNAGNNILIGNASDNTLTGNDGNDTLNPGNDGLDFLIGGKGSDIYHVNHATVDVVEALNQGNDTAHSHINVFGLWMNVENLVLLGSASIGGGNDLNNLITGNSGANEIIGREGNDTLTGRAGGDTFEFDAGSGKDRITDFAAGAGGADVIRFVGGQFTDFADVLAHSKNVGAHMVITASSDTITLLGVHVNQLDAGDFLFA